MSRLAGSVPGPMPCRVPFDAPYGRGISAMPGDATRHRLSEGDLRSMARMRHTGVSYADLSFIFDVSVPEARRCVYLYACEAACAMARGR